MEMEDMGDGRTDWTIDGVDGWVGFGIQGSDGMGWDDGSISRLLTKLLLFEAGRDIRN
jgi:hypothetical protein